MKNENTDTIRLNREAAYMGNLGRLREEFCINYIKNKQVALNRIQDEILEQIRQDNKEATCQKGCSSCCSLYIEANLQECEAIVYYLYNNSDILSVFLRQYPVWRNIMRQSGDVFRRCEQALKKKRDKEYDAYNQQELADALLFYKLQNNPCPFLNNGICTIYEVRPYTCANHFVTTPSEWCSPMDPRHPKVYQTDIEDEIFDIGFYQKKVARPIITFMPLAVYGIMSGGFSFLADVTGFKELTKK
jgi:Fe-S-cluster containining protein